MPQQRHNGDRNQIRESFMRIQTFHGPELSVLSREVELVLGSDAVILRTEVVPHRFGPQLRLVAAAGADFHRLRTILEPAALPVPGSGGEPHPYRIAFVGPTGAGKTTTLAKLALHPTLLAGRRPGILTLDTFRTGALEQLESYATLADLPLEIVYSREEIPAALERLATCDLILVDCPGGTPRDTERNRVWMEMLGAIEPDEVHLVLPAALRLEVVRAAADLYASVGVTHLLPSKLDEVASDASIAEVVLRLRRPARWLTDGPGIPEDVHLAPRRVLAALAHMADPRMASRPAA